MHKRRNETNLQALFAVLRRDEDVQMMVPQVVPELRCTVVRRGTLETLGALIAANTSGALLREVLPDLGGILPHSL